jgi:hypothetical protein
VEEVNSFFARLEKMCPPGRVCDITNARGHIQTGIILGWAPDHLEVAFYDGLKVHHKIAIMRYESIDYVEYNESIEEEFPYEIRKCSWREFSRGLGGRDNTLILGWEIKTKLLQKNTVEFIPLMCEYRGLHSVLYSDSDVSLDGWVKKPHESVLSWATYLRSKNNSVESLPVWPNS